MPDASNPTFDDVDATSVYWPYIEALWATDPKITNGISTSPPLFGPSQDCTHSQLRVWLMRGKVFADAAFVAEDTQGPELFVDVDQNHWAYSFVQRAAKWGVDGGPEREDQADGELGEASAVTRGQAAVLFVRALGELPLDDKTDATFLDVPTSHPKFGYIEKLYALGITVGTGSGNYSPDQNLSREQMAVFMRRAFQIPFVTPGPPEQ